MTQVLLFLKTAWDFIKKNTYIIWVVAIGFLTTLLKIKNSKIENLNKDLKNTENKLDDVITVNRENKTTMDKKTEDSKKLEELNKQIREERKKQGLPNVSLGDKDNIDLGKWGQP